MTCLLFTTTAGLASTVILGLEYRVNHDQILLSHIPDSYDLEGQVLVYTPPPPQWVSFSRLLRLAGLRRRYRIRLGGCRKLYLRFRRFLGSDRSSFW
jgi:hypothetical protein